MNGMMAEDMKENIKMTKSMAMEFTNGLMEGFIWAIGLVENNMD